MATRYCGPGGNDANSGLSWALRKLTLNGVEDTPVVAGDVCYIAPGAYRERLTVDVDGGAGTEIVYIGDATGQWTDGIGGIVRVTGSDNDQTAARNYCITADTKDHRVFRGFSFDTASAQLIDLDTGCENWDIEDCTFQGDTYAARVDDAQLEIHFRRCCFLGTWGIAWIDGAMQDNVGSLLENCVFIGSVFGLQTARIGNIAVRNCAFIGCGSAIQQYAAPNAGQTLAVENCIFYLTHGTALSATGAAFLLEDYNSLYGNSADRNNVNVGGNSNTFPPLWLLPILYSGAAQASGFKFGWLFGALSQWSQIRAIAGNNEPAVDFFGIRRPATAAKNSWGPIQYQDMEVETGTVQAGTYGRVLHDAGSVLVRRIPVTGVQITVTLYVRREANYAGNLPRMIIKQPGAADQITTSVAAVNTWEQLSDTFTPNALPGYVDVYLESRNTAVALAYEVFYDTMDVT